MKFVDSLDICNFYKLEIRFPSLSTTITLYFLSLLKLWPYFLQILERRVKLDLHSTQARSYLKDAPNL
jgi:hypothetical protein